MITNLLLFYGAGLIVFLIMLALILFLGRRIGDFIYARSLRRGGELHSTLATLGGLEISTSGESQTTSANEITAISEDQRQVKIIVPIDDPEADVHFHTLEQQKQNILSLYGLTY